MDKGNLADLRRMARGSDAPAGYGCCARSTPA
jgi:hypothetical protein